MAIQKIKRQKGIVYRVRLLINGRRVTKCFDRRYDAVQFEQNARFDNRTVDGMKMTFDQAANDWLENHARPRKAASTLYNNESIIKKDLIPEFGKIKLADIKPHHVDSFISKLRNRMGNSSVNNRLELIRAIFNYHIRRKNVLYSPMDGVSFLKVNPKPMRIWMLDEARQFLEHSKSKYEGTEKEHIYLLYMIALNTGMRFGEMLGLKWSAVDFTNRLITVCRSLCHYTLQIRETTKGGRIRHVPINDALIEPLKAASARKNGMEWVLHSNGSLLNENNIRKRHWKHDIKESGVSCIRIHDMRHTFASHFLMQGGDLFKLQAILGHADIRTTMRYAHFSRAYLLENMNIVRFEAKGNVIHVPFRKTGTNK